MRINGTGFKVDTTTYEPPAGVTGQEEASATTEQLTTEVINDFLTYDETEGPNAPASPSSNPIDDYTFGSYHDSQPVAPANGNFLNWLDDFPPTIEEIVTANENAIDFLDIFLQKYEKSAEDITKIIVNARETLANPTITATEAANLNTVITKGEAALIRINHGIEKTKELGIRRGNIFIAEMNEWKDLNNDGWIGNKLYYVTKDKEGNIVYIDPKTKLPVANPILDPDYEPRLTENGALEITTSPHNPPAAEDKSIDLFLRLTPQALTSFAANNEFQTPIAITPPLAFWVEKNEDAGENSYELDREGPDVKMKIYDQWEDNGGVRQKIPSNRQNYLQVKVEKMKVVSTQSEHDGYNHEIEFYDKDGTLIARIRIEGFETTRDFPTAHEGYVEASSVGFGIYGQFGPVEIDASQFVSTGQHVVDNLAAKLGITRPGSGRGRDAFDKNMEPFTKNSGEGFGNYRDRYISAGDPDKKATGIFIGGYTRGYTMATRYNDVIKTAGVDEFSPEARERMPEDSPPMKKTNGQYTNFVYADAGTNIVVSGKGDNWIFDGTLVSVKGSSNDENYISTPAISRLREGGEREETLNNPAAFIRVEGGRASIDNPDETDLLAENDAMDEANERIDSIEEDERRDNPDYDLSDNRVDEVQQEELADVETGYKNDYYQISGGASVAFTNPNDPDIAGNYTPSSSHRALGRVDMEVAALDRFSKWRDEMLKIPEVNEAEITAFLQEAGEAETELANEMNGFFNAMFGDINSFFTEQEVEPAEGAEIAGRMGGGFGEE